MSTVYKKDLAMTLQKNVTLVTSELDLQNTYSQVINVTYYSIFLPITLFGNVLSIAVGAMIVYHRRNRRSIADLLLGALASVDLFSLFTVHAVSLVYIMNTDLHHLSKGVSIFQAFSASIYMKLQFLIQICISLDRYLALVRPLQYNTRITSRRMMFMISSVLVILTSSSSILLATTCPPQIEVLRKWPISLFKWSFKCIPHAIVASLTCVVFAVGIIVFTCCNLNLVRILWQYRSQREKINEFSHVVNVLEKKVSQHLQASQSTLHKFRINKLNESRSNSLRTPEVQIQLTSGDKEDDRKSSNNCNGGSNYMSQNSHESSKSSEILLRTPHLTNGFEKDNELNESHSLSHDSSVYHSLCESNDSESNSCQVAKAKVIRTKNIHNLKIIINVEEPTSSPEVGTPDSQCNLIEGQVDGKVPIDNKRKLTPETPEIRIEGPVDEENKSHNDDNHDNDFCCHGNDGAVINTCSLVPNQEEESRGSPSTSSPRPRTPNILEIHSPKPKKSVSFSSVILDACPKPEYVREDPIERSPSVVKADPTLMTHLTDYFHKVLKSWGKKTEKQRREVLLARLVAVCSSIYLATWIPYTVTVLLSITGRQVNPTITDVSLRLIFVNAALNPIFYGLCRSNYRKGYQYISIMVLHYIFCGLVPKPGDDKIFFESKTKKVKRHQAAADMNMHMRVRRQRRRAMSANALQILQQLRLAVSPGEIPMPGFQPSNKLQVLFQQCMELEMSDSESSSFDYDNMIFTDSIQQDFLQSLKHIWSLYDLESSNQNTNHDDDDDDDDDLDDLEFNYDDIISSDHNLDEVFYGIEESIKKQGPISTTEEMPNDDNNKTTSSFL